MKYRAHACVTISISTVVEANSPEEAKEKAEEEAQMMTFCHQCSSPSYPSEEINTWWTSGELDGTPFDITVEEEE